MGLTIAIVAILGVALIIVETFIPGWIAGILGVLCILASVGLVMTADEFAAWPGWTRTVAACGIVVGSGLALLAWLRFFGSKAAYSHLTLHAAVPPVEPNQSIAPGVEGVAVTELRPLGRAEFGGERREVRCEDGFAPAGSRLRVTGSEPGNLLVRLL